MGDIPPLVVHRGLWSFSHADNYFSNSAGIVVSRVSIGDCMHVARCKGSKKLIREPLFFDISCRFSPTEVARHGSSFGAACFYGDAAAEFLGAHLSSASLDSVIGLLLLSLHEFSMKKGREAWFHLGMCCSSNHPPHTKFHQKLI